MTQSVPPQSVGQMPPDWNPTPTTTNGTPTAASVDLASGLDQDDLAADVRRERDGMRGLLEQIYGPEIVDDWLNLGLPPPAVRPDPPGAILFEASVGAVTIKRAKDGPRLQVQLTADLSGAPIRELAGLTEGVACEVRLAPAAVQVAFPNFAPRLEPPPQERLPDEDEDEDGDDDVARSTGAADPDLPPPADPRRQGPAPNRRVQPR